MCLEWVFCERLHSWWPWIEGYKTEGEGDGREKGRESCQTRHVQGRQKCFNNKTLWHIRARKVRAKGRGRPGPEKRAKIGLMFQLQVVIETLREYFCCICNIFGDGTPWFTVGSRFFAAYWLWALPPPHMFPASIHHTPKNYSRERALLKKASKPHKNTKSPGDSYSPAHPQGLVSDTSSVSWSPLAAPQKSCAIFLNFRGYGINQRIRWRPLFLSRFIWILYILSQWTTQKRGLQRKIVCLCAELSRFIARILARNGLLW